MLGKYLKDLGIKEVNTPQGWNKDDSRQERWIKEREIYGFDEKETWSMGSHLSCGYMRDCLCIMK